MKTTLKHNFQGYFAFFYGVLGSRLIFDIFLSISVSFLDGIGLAMFIPLLQSMDENGKPGGADSMGKLHFFTDLFDHAHIPLNIYTVLIALALLFIFKGVLKYAQLRSQVSLRQTFTKGVRYELTSDLQHLSYVGFIKQDAGKLQNIITTEVQKLHLALLHYLNSVSGVAMLFTYVVMAFLANWQFAFLVAIGSALSNLIFSGIVKTIKAASLKISGKGNVFNAYLIEAVHYFKYLKATSQFKGFSGKIRTVIDETEVLDRQIGNNQAITASIREPLVMLIVVIVIILQIRWMGGNLSSIILSLLLFYRALSFLMDFQKSWQNFIQNIGAMQSVSDLSEEMKKSREVQSEVPFPAFRSVMEIKDLKFNYGEKTVLNRVNMTIPKNHTIAFVGESGSGKTTMANMITGILPPAEGSISFDGVPISAYNLDSYREKIGYISQEAVIFKDDVFNNITFWAPYNEENIRRFWEVIELSSLTEFVNNLADQEKTPLGDKGMLISGGQKQRISIARELFKRADILILDEATSALDSETEMMIQQNIEKLQGKYTMFIIAHRLSTIKNADMIYVMDKGEITHSGTFDELIAASPRFMKMVSLQQL
ncbi:ABC transporter ATP-binding protein [Pedobacter sp. AW31-3R]|uniref:ABC transporter ATP-binding protein n=1 Tax=Pedobacter sp. AW31-3R TaxID=3445781 RepID=UPI003FA0B1DC